MADKNSKVLERLAFVAGVKIEDLKEAIGSLFKETDVAVLKLDKFSEERKEQFIKKLNETGNQMGVALRLPSPLPSKSRHSSRSREAIVKMAIERLSSDSFNKYPVFYVNFEKRTVVCLIKSVVNDKVISRGIAKCSPDDCFNEYIGKVIALYRAEGFRVPEYFLDVPQPDLKDVRKGDVLRWGEIDYFIDQELDESLVNMFSGDKRIKIINDSGRY